MSEGRTFFTPAFPLEEVFDPTGAGDAFAGGFMGYLARHGTLNDEEFRRAMIYGSVMGSFAVSQFGINGFNDVTSAQVEKRARAFRELTHVELVEPAA
jgi:sugar/nucleoside kinase (ribokinase family)